MEERHFRHIHNVLARRQRKHSNLHDHVALIKVAYEGGLGVPTICKILEGAEVAEGTSIPNVQGFIRRQQKLGVIGEKGCRKEEFNCRLEEAAKGHATSSSEAPSSPEHTPNPQTEGRSSEAKSHSPLLKSLNSLSSSMGHTPPSDTDNPVTKLKKAVERRRS